MLDQKEIDRIIKKTLRILALRKALTKSSKSALSKRLGK